MGGSGSDIIVGLINEYRRDHTDSFAGSWVHGNGLRVAFTDDLEGHQDRLAALLRERGPVEIVRARWTFADLDALAARIATRKGQPVAGVSLTAVGVDVVNNRVSVMVVAVNQAVREELAAEYRLLSIRQA